VDAVEDAAGLDEAIVGIDVDLRAPGSIVNVALLRLEHGDILQERVVIWSTSMSVVARL